MKARRQAAIMRIIRSQPISTQDELVEALRKAGYQVTQATVSRDIADMGLVKRAVPEGGYRWVLPPDPGPREALERARRAFSDYTVGLDYSGNLIIVRTLPGAAHAVAATIDALDWPEVLATLAGDDTILVVVAQPEAMEKEPEGPVGELLQRFRELMFGG